MDNDNKKHAKKSMLHGTCEKGFIESDKETNTDGKKTKQNSCPEITDEALNRINQMHGYSHDLG